MTLTESSVKELSNDVCYCDNRISVIKVVISLLCVNVIVVIPCCIVVTGLPDHFRITSPLAHEVLLFVVGNESKRECGNVLLIFVYSGMTIPIIYSVCR